MEAEVRVELNITLQSDKKTHHSVTWNMLFSVFLLVGWKTSCYSFKTTMNCSNPPPFIINELFLGRVPPTEGGWPILPIQV